MLNTNIDRSRKLEVLIDEKCRILNKTGTPKGTAIHLAKWMKEQIQKLVDIIGFNKSIEYSKLQ